MKPLYDAAKAASGEVSYRQIESNPELRIGTSALGGWLNGEAAPLELAKYMALVDYLEDKCGRPHHPRAVWLTAIKNAMDERDRNQGGRPRKGTRAATVDPLRYVRTAQQLLPTTFVGREAELDRLTVLIREESGYLALVAPPWAGKTAFLAAFVLHRVPEDTDVIAYFVRRGTSADNATHFRRKMIAQLRLLVGKKGQNKTGTDDEATLLDLYEEAAHASIVRSRRLLLVIDGLDEDAGADFVGQSIASLLPKQAHPGLCVLVSRRWHPPLPTDVDEDHPLRGARAVTGFRSSPEAHARRNAALRDLAALLNESTGWGRQVVGFLTVARGGLAYSDLRELIEGGGHGPVPTPYELEEALGHVAGRVLGPDDLAPGTFVLAHGELHRTAEQSLSPRTLAELTERLHAWADGYRADGWPESTPAYLLHPYQERLRSTHDLDRFTTFALDHRRLLRLADRGRTDFALASLDDVTHATPTPAVLASAAASRSLLEGQDRVVPREVLRALVVVGDIARARSIALSPMDPASKAARLIDVVRALPAMKTADGAKQASDLAREAARWAERARHQDTVSHSAAELDTHAIIPRAAVALAAVGLTDEAIRLLNTVDTCRPDHVSAVAEAASLLLRTDPAVAGGLLDQLTYEAEYQAEAEEGRPAFAVEAWAAVAAADPARAESIHRVMKEFAEGLEAASVGLAAADCPALVASALADAMPDEARELAESAWRNVLEAQDIAPPDELRESLARAAQALLDVGKSPDEVHAELADVPAELASRAALLLDGFPDGEDEEAAETAELLADMDRLSDLGDGPQLRQCLDRFMARTTEQSAPVAWLPFLAEALAGAADDHEEALSRVVAGLPDTPLYVRVLTSAALAHSEVCRRDAALWCAEKAAGIAQRMKDSQSPEVRALVAQAFAHAGDAERARAWAAPAHGRRGRGKAGIPYRRAALAVEVGLEPEALVARTVADGLPRIGIGGPGADLVEALHRHAAGARTAAHVAKLETTAHVRLRSDPLLATGLALLHAVLGDTERAHGTVADLPDPAARGTALATVAAYLAGVPAHLDVAADGDDWTLSVLRTLAHHMRPAGEGPHDATVVRKLAVEALGTSAWYQALPVLARTGPEAVHGVVDVLDQHRESRRAGS
ncbi:hypothetical protein ACT1U9_03695 [Streptomyces sp. BR1]